MAGDFDIGRAPSTPSLTPGATSFYSAPENHLDPRLFAGMVMHPEVRADITDRYFGHMDARYVGARRWSRLWLAGSGASYQWSADREPGDLDMLVGIDYPEFRRMNERHARMGDAEISRMVTEGFRADLTPSTSSWSPPGSPSSTYEMTFFSNPGSTDIRDIKPYAAYDVVSGTWDVPPDAHPFVPSYNADADADRQRALTVIDRYTAAQSALANTNLHPVARTAHRRALQESLQQASALFDEIHLGRHSAFGPGGKGYGDPANVRWQSGKASGVVPALKVLKDFLESQQAGYEIAMYGVRLPDADDLILRALMASGER